MTRRVVKLNIAGRVHIKGFEWHPNDPNAVRACPYGVVGDRLWVRETFYACDDYNFILRFAADGPAPTNGRHYKKRPSIFMPRSASRITLEITNVKIERLNQISNTDILREGIRSESCNICVHSGGSGCDSCFSIIKPFRELWDSINGKAPGKSWEDNPLVWVVEFKRVDE